MPTSGFSSACAALVLWAAPAAGFEFLSMPVACTAGGECAIAQYFDTDPSSDARDYLCGAMTYDGHKGTDFAIANYAAMDRGVTVLAAAAGQVVAVRDGEVDQRGDGDPAATRDRECGNGVVVEHADGLVTQYCHLRQGSPTVLPGDRVDAGTPLGLIGQSGLAAFPHLHFEVRLNGRSIDPFSGRPADGCGNAGIMSWGGETARALPYFAGFPYHAGFAGDTLDTDLMRAGGYGDLELTPDSPAIVLWVEMWGVAVGDRVALTITAPDGSVLVADESEIDSDQARRYRFVGRPAADGAQWTAGTYTGDVAYLRAADGHRWSRTLTVDVQSD